jgi:hypothetical protein
VLAFFIFTLENWALEFASPGFKPHENSRCFLQEMGHCAGIHGRFDNRLFNSLSKVQSY